MPVIVVGADTSLGGEIVRALLGRNGEVRAFVTDLGVAKDLKSKGVKVAIGDVTDASHVGGAALNCFSAVLVPEAAFDERERSFASDPATIFDHWREALDDAAVRRAIWLEDERAPGAAEQLRSAVTELAVVKTDGRPPKEIATEVARLDDAAEI